MAGPLQPPGKRFNLRPRTERQKAGKDKEAFNKQKRKTGEDTGRPLTKLIAVRAYSAGLGWPRRRRQDTPQKESGAIRAHSKGFARFAVQNLVLRRGVQSFGVWNFP